MNKNLKSAVILAGVIISIALTSCQVTNKYKSPEVDTQNLFRDENPTDTTTIANIPWMKYFPDTLLQSLIAEGLAENYDLQIAFSRIKQAEANLSMARAAYFPSITLAGQVTHSRNSVDQSGNKDVLGNYNNNYTLGAATTWELDIWGKMNRRTRAQYAQFLSSQSYRNLIQTSLIANIATSYYSLLALDEQLRITQENIGLLEKSVATMKDMKEAGLLNAAAVEQSKSLLYSTQITVPNLEIQIRTTENSICVMLGRKPGAIARSTFDAQSVPDELQHGVPVQMLAKRPDVQQAELAFRSAFEMTNVARANFYPSITLNTGSLIGYGATNLTDFFSPQNLILNVIGGFTQPLFAKKQLTGNLKIAKAQQEEALLTFQQTVLSASQEVSDVLFTYQSSMSKNEIRKKQIDATKTSVYYTQELLKAGEANYTEVINAQTNMLQAQLGQATDKMEQLQSVVNLYRALGGGTQ